MANKILVALLAILASFWLCLLANVPGYKIQAGFERIWQAFQTASVVSILLLVLALLVGLFWLAWRAYSNGIIWYSEARLKKYQADGEELKANLVISIAPAGSQIYASETGRLSLTHKPLYLAPGNVNGKTIEYQQDESRRWYTFNLLQNISHKPDVTKLDEIATIQQVLPDHVDLSHYLLGTPSLRNIFLGVGKYPDGQVKPVSAPLERLVHIAEAGSSGFGKSTHMQALAYQCLNAREAPNVILLDAQGVTFTPFSDSTLKYPIASKESVILAILLELVGEMERRQELFSQWRGIATLAQYNQAVSESERLAQVPVFFDEFGLVAGNKDIAKQIKLLAQGGRKCGISLIAGSQTWMADEISTSLRANLSTSIQFYARDKSTSRILLGDSSAANITRPGQAFCRLPGIAGLVELQAPDPSNLIDSVPMLLEAPQAIPELEPSEQERQILELNDNGASLAEICTQVYGYKSSNRYPDIKAVIERYRGVQGANGAN